MMAGNDQDERPGAEAKPAGKDAPGGPSPQGHEHMNGPGMTNGVPDAASQGDATGGPSSERQETETLGGVAAGNDD